MGPSRDIRLAGTGPQLRVRRIAALLAAALMIASPLAAQASVRDDLKDLPLDASPKQACDVLIGNGAIKRAKRGSCRRLVAKGFGAAKTASDNGAVTIASAAACTTEALRGRIPHGQVGPCAKRVAKRAGGGKGEASASGFDPVGAVGDAVGAVGGAVGDVFGGVGGAIGGVATGALLDGFKAIINLLFGDLQSAMTVALIKWITTIPNLSGGHVGHLESSIAIGASGLLAATMTISIVRFWSSGLTGDGAWAGAEGVARAAIAAALIGLWPQIFNLAIRLANALQSGILGGGVQAELKALFRDLDVIGFVGGAPSGGMVPLFLAIVIAVVGILMLLALVAMKIVITALTIVLFCAMPLALVVWPIPELAGIARFCLRTLAVVLAIPIVWCLIFGAFAAIGADTFSFHNTGKDQGILGTALNVAVVRPLVAISLLYLALVLPKRLLQLAPFFSGRPGVIRHVGTGMAVRAGFSYAPRVGAAAAAGWKGNPTQRTQVFGSSAEKAAATQARGLRESLGAAKEKGKSLASRFAGQTSQAAKGAGSKNGSNAEGAASQEGAGRRTGSRAAGGAKGASTSVSGIRLGKAPFHGPRTMQPTIGHAESIDGRRREMEAAPKSGGGVTSDQAREAVGVLHAHRSPSRKVEGPNGPVEVGKVDDPALFNAARKASFHSDSTEATGAFAEWSLTDNEQVSRSEKDAFWALGNASPSQRKKAFTDFEKSSSTTGGKPSPGGSTNRPTRPKSSSSQRPSPSRAPHGQPHQRGGVWP